MLQVGAHQITPDMCQQAGDLDLFTKNALFPGVVGHAAMQRGIRAEEAWHGILQTAKQGWTRNAP
jgi:hypothetical protein